jgi:ABC-type uncharacterized transport system substrate-binding protein
VNVHAAIRSPIATGPRSPRLALTLALHVCFAAILYAEENNNAVAVLITSKESYHTAANAAVERLKQSGYACELTIVSDDDPAALHQALERLRNNPPRIILASGAGVTEEILARIPDIPVVFMMTPNALDCPFLDPSSPRLQRVAGASSDPSPETLLAWIRKTSPRSGKLALLSSDRSRRTAELLSAAAQTAGITLTPVSARRDQFPAAIDALNAGDYEGVLMIPDSQVYNAPNVERLLLWGLREKRPVWAFSDKVVKAGALAAASCDPAAVGRKSADVADRILKGAAPRDIGVQYADKTEYAVNVRTAEMIGVTLGKDVPTPPVARYGEGD